MGNHLDIFQGLCEANQKQFINLQLIFNGSNHSLSQPTYNQSNLDFQKKSFAMNGSKSKGFPHSNKQKINKNPIIQAYYLIMPIAE